MYFCLLVLFFFFVFFFDIYTSFKKFYSFITFRLLIYDVIIESSWFDTLHTFFCLMCYFLLQYDIIYTGYLSVSSPS